MVSNIAITSLICLHTVCSIWSIDKTLSGANTPSQSEPGSNGNERVLHIPQISKAGASPSDGFISYPGHLLGCSYPSVEMPLVYSTALPDWVHIYIMMKQPPTKCTNIMTGTIYKMHCHNDKATVYQIERHYL